MFKPKFKLVHNGLIKLSSVSQYCNMCHQQIDRNTIAYFIKSFSVHISHKAVQMGNTQTYIDLDLIWVSTIEQTTNSYLA